jgi:hypothetical protein
MSDAGASDGGREGRTVSPRRVDATVRDGRVSIDAETRTASLSVRPARHAPLSEDGPVARLHLADGDALDVTVSLKPADVAAIRDVFDGVGAAEVFDGP